MDDLATGVTKGTYISQEDVQSVLMAKMDEKAKERVRRLADIAYEAGRVLVS